MADTASVLGRRRAAALFGMLGRLPLPILYGISSLLFAALFHLARYQRALLLENLRRAFPDKSTTARRRLAAACYRNAIDTVFETVKAGRMDVVELLQRVEIDNPNCLHTLLQEHRTVIVLTAHSGNWEWLHLACAASFDAPIAAVYNPLSHPGIDAQLLALRMRFGSRLIEKDGALPALIAFSRGGGLIALNTDQLPRPEDDKYWARFMGIDTAFFTGPEKLARLFQAPAVFAGMRRVRRGHYRVHFEPLSTPPHPNEVNRILPAYVKALERQLRAAPQDWAWLYKRWKYPKPLFDNRTD